MARIAVKRITLFRSADIHIDYEAEVQLLMDCAEVTVEADKSVIDGHYQDEVDSLVTAVRQGAESVLQPRQLGATIRIIRADFHPVDFHPRGFPSPDMFRANSLGICSPD